jgi:hypothetical protein
MNNISDTMSRLLEEAQSALTSPSHGRTAARARARRLTSSARRQG